MKEIELATDIQLILKNLTSFYDFRQREVLHVGAGIGQLIGYAAITSHVLAVENEKEACQILRNRINQEKLAQRISVIEEDFYKLSIKADVVLFEFCLHEMMNPSVATEKAKSIAKDVVVIDHQEDSPWTWYANETEKASLSWEAVRKNGICRSRDFDAIQFFRDYDELFNKVKIMGTESIQRISKYQNSIDIEILMKYRIALLE